MDKLSHEISSILNNTNKTSSPSEMICFWNILEFLIVLSSQPRILARLLLLHPNAFHSFITYPPSPLLKWSLMNIIFISGVGKLQSCQLPVYINKVLLEHSHTHQFRCCLCFYVILIQSWVIITQSIWPKKPYIYYLALYRWNCPISRKLLKGQLFLLIPTLHISLKHSFYYSSFKLTFYNP